MTELAEADQTVNRRVMPRDEAVKFFRNLGELYKAEIIASDPGQGGDQPLRPGRLGRPVPRPARALHRQAQGLQADQARRRLLARGFAQRDAAADLRHRLGRTRSSWRSTCTASRRPRSATTAASARNSTCSICRKRRRARCSGTPRAGRVFQALIGYMRERQGAAGYEEVNAPELMDAQLWAQSGHLEKFGENMYLTKTPDERTYAIKPMNCPGHVQIFKQGLRSYRELPVRLAEFGKVHRYEPSGALHGLMRVRAFTQDDGALLHHRGADHRRVAWPSRS